MAGKLRLQRFLAQAGVASRRKAEELILAGRISVNGRSVREVGVSVDPHRDQVTVDGNRVLLEDRVWLLLNKPPGAVTTVSDPEGRQTVIDLIGNQGVRLYPVGRLDFYTEGVLLLTNDGDLANSLMHPSHQVPRTYQVKLRGIIDPDDLERLRQGVPLDGKTVKAERLHILGTTEKNTWVELTIHQGMNRQVHRMMEAIGATVLRLIRVSYAGITVEGLRPGEYRALTQEEVNELRTAAGLKHETVRAEAVMPGRRSRGTLDRKAAGQARPRPERTRERAERGRPRVERVPRERKRDETREKDRGRSDQRGRREQRVERDQGRVKRDQGRVKRDQGRDQRDQGRDKRDQSRDKRDQGRDQRDEGRDQRARRDQSRDKRTEDRAPQREERPRRRDQRTDDRAPQREERPRRDQRTEDRAPQREERPRRRERPPRQRGAKKPGKQREQKPAGAWWPTKKTKKKPPPPGDEQ